MGKYIPNVGDKVKGFKFDSGTDGVGYDTEMDDYVEEVGVVVDVYTDSFVVQFTDSLEWMYPASLSHLAKIEEPAQELPHEDSQIDWMVGQEVWDVCYGKGEVVEITCSDYPIVVQFALDEVMSYTLQGKVHNDYNRTLFFSEPTVIADTMPPKKPFTPTLKNGDEVVVRMVSGSISAFIVEEECEEYIKFKDVDYFLYKKRIASINKFGEQIKVDGVK